MKTTQYITLNNHNFTKYELKPAVKLGGVLTAKINENAPIKGFGGFGVAITGASCYNLNQMSEQDRLALIKNVYTKDGLDLQVARLTIGSSDYSAELYSYDDVPNDIELKHFSIDRDREYIIPMIKEILKVKPDLYLYASPWSPPGWMKTGGSMCGGFMREDFIDCYADYIIKFLKAYADEGIQISAVTVQNETETHQAGKMPACMWHPDIEAKFAIVLRNKLTAAGLDTKIMILDHNFDSVNRALWQLDTYDELKNACNGVAMHYYAGGIEATTELAERYPELERHFTEGGPRLYDNYATDWCKWVIMISKVLNNGFKSFTGWNLLLDETGGPNIGPFFCGGLITRDTIENTLKYSGQYKALKHVSQFINTESEIYPVEFTNNAPCIFGYPNLGQPVQGTMWKNPDGKRYLLIANPNKTKRQVQVEVDGTWWYIELLPDTVSTVVFE